MNPLFARAAVTAASALLAMIAAELLGFAPSLETLIGAFFVGGFAAAFIAPRADIDIGTPAA